MSPGAAGAEEGENPGALQMDDDGAMEARFANLCKSVAGIDEGTAEEALALFGESKEILLGIMSSVGSGTPDVVERFWSAFLLYCVVRLCTGKETHESSDGRVKLSQILEAAKLNALVFFKEVSHFALKADNVLSIHYGPDWEKRIDLKELHANADQLCWLSRFYKKAYHQLFKVSASCSGRKLLVSSHEDYVSDYHCFGWLLFLELRAHLFSHFKDLVTYTNALVSILAILILHVPTSSRNFVISDSPFFTKKSGKGVDLLASLSQSYDASEVELWRMTEKVNKLVVDVLKKKPCHASECKAESLYNINTDELIYFEDLLDEKSLRSNLFILNMDYDDIIKSKVELDERIFLNIEDRLDVNGSLNFSGDAISVSHGRDNVALVSTPAKSIINRVASHPGASPPNGNFVGNSRMAQWTPVSSTMTTAKWLREVVSPLSSRPSSGLHHFLTFCDTDLKSPVIHRANVILEAIFPTQYGERCIHGSLQGANIMDSVWAEQRKLESLKLYYRVLEAICKAESQRLSDNNLTSLLSSERFHRCMLACAAELVLATHKTVTMMFPAVLERTGITAFDLSKVIESFVRHEETLPRELKRHLNSLEERLLESLSWEKGSSLYNSLIVAKPALATDINRLGLLADPMPSLDSIALHKNIAAIGTQPSTSQKHASSSGRNGESRSPKRLCSENRGVVLDPNILKSPVRENQIAFNSPKSKLPSLQSAFASPACPNPSTGGEPCAEAGISTFFSKILKLAAIRIKSLCERLGVPQHFLEHVYFLIQQILSQRTALFFNRHIDQLILCSIYGVNKILNLDLTFKAIIYNYRKQPQSRTQVFRSVYVNWSSIQNTKKGHEHIDIITFYNEVFIPSVKPLLVELGSSKVENSNSLAQDKSNNPIGHIPSSPRLANFPNLPDMSPKKVSASHNVYVSPLRQSKMDALLAPSSKSYYACVGESTHAFQSPSKDLMVINSRLNCGGGGGRRVGGRLNFDLVSDSIVAGSLGPQNGSSGSSAAVEVTVKSEQPDL
ncbi:retinoblastoma-related protein-like isoform X2 [Phalaenopsis equestris]|uniref:retinoblastoma-related protein-like isoform X2 n=1 Tax=Phalaenopsis equestris TaxID=78828 RepID=UPI0009E3C126|nr:retinoblastoma-related protein-like isoform X2 [Phalaenopsis equestris]